MENFKKVLSNSESKVLKDLDRRKIIGGISGCPSRSVRICKDGGFIFEENLISLEEIKLKFDFKENLDIDSVYRDYFNSRNEELESIDF
jgi:hypothetical protein